jgi:hypothetical protein
MSSCRAVAAGAQQLGALGSRLAAVARRGHAAELIDIQQQLAAACTLAGQLARIAARHRFVRAAPALGRCVTLPLECGHALMTRPAVGGSESTRYTANILAVQAALLADLMDSNREDLALVAQLAAPEQLLAWLSAAASKLLALGNPSHDRGRWFNVLHHCKSEGCPGATICAALTFRHCFAYCCSPALQLTECPLFPVTKYCRSRPAAALSQNCQHHCRQKVV